MKISRIYVTVDGVDYRLLGSELNIELDIRVRELILKALLTSKINHIERDQKMSPPEAVNEPTIAKSTVELKAYFDGTRNWIDYKDLCIADKLSTMHCVTHDRNGKKLDTGSKRLALNLKTISILSWAGNQWVKRNELSDKLFKIPEVGLSKSSIKVYLTDLEKIGFLESAVDKDLNKCVRINEELYKA